jgi:hypothetical protein
MALAAALISTSGKLFISKKKLEHLWLYSFNEAQQVGFIEG